MEIAEEVYDFYNQNWVKPLYDHYTEIEGGNLLGLPRIEILEQYRVKDICKKVVKDIYNNIH
jgi:hypothetical protein